MMFSTKAEYGVRVMVELARRAGEEPIPLAEIAAHDGLPLAYLEHLVARLRKADLVTSRRGSRGGYMLARPPAEISMAEVVEALEGSIAPIECISEAADGSIVCSRESDASHTCAYASRSSRPCARPVSPTCSARRCLSGRSFQPCKSGWARSPSQPEPERRPWPT